MLTMERADKKRNKLMIFLIDRQQNTIYYNLYLLLFHGNGGSRQGEKQVTPGQTYTHNTRPFSETYLLNTAMKGADKGRNRLFLVKQSYKHKTRTFSKTNRL